MLTATFHGHACFLLEGDGKRVVIDPFLTGNPAAVIGPDELPKVDAILLSHGHGDHLGDAIALAKRDKATIVATYELAQFCGDKPKIVIPMHYNTWEVNRADPRAFQRDVGNQAQVVILAPGESYQLSQR